MKAILFDLDGVLVDAVAIHRQAFLHALELQGVRMTCEEHDATLNGLPTVVKLSRLVKAGRLQPKAAPLVIEAKQQATRRLVEEQIALDPAKVAMMRSLLAAGYRLGVVSNAIRSTVWAMLKRTGLDEFMEVVLSNEDVERTKPAPDPWWMAMAALGVTADETLIVEDSPPGIESAHASGAMVLEVSGPQDVTFAAVVAALSMEAVA